MCSQIQGGLGRELLAVHIPFVQVSIFMLYYELNFQIGLHKHRSQNEHVKSL